jgi:hypothetical protein
MPIQTAIDSISNSQGSPFGFKNRIINGAMVIDQRNAGASANNVAASGTYAIDRWRYYGTSVNKFSVQQNAGSVTPPTGFTNYLGITSLSANSPDATDEYAIQQYIEGYNIADLDWGTANAKTITLSFWVRSSLTGTFSGVAKNNAGNRTYPFSYTINQANTWEYETITIPGDTTGSWLTTNGRGIALFFNLGTGSTYLQTANAWTASFANGATGSVNVLGTNGATFYITGVQLERGTQATSFDYRDYGRELQLCQRYFQKITGNTSNGYANFANAVAYTSGSGAFRFQIYLPVVMRTAPSFAQVGNFVLLGVVSGSVSGMSLADSGGNPIVGMLFTSPSAGSAGQVSVLRGDNDTTAAMLFSAEL